MEWFESWRKGTRSSPPPSFSPCTAPIAGTERRGGEEIARYLPQFLLMSQHLEQTSKQIESSVVEVCGSFQGIAQRAQQTVARATNFLVREGDSSSQKQSFEDLIRSCSGTLLRILSTTEEASEISRRAIDSIRKMEEASQMISGALVQLEEIAEGNKFLAMNARIEAAHAGSRGAGFAVVAAEVMEQAAKSREVIDQVAGLIAQLRALAGSTLEDLQRMIDRDHERVRECRREVDDSLRDLEAAYGEMKTMLTGMMEEGTLLASEIGAAVRGLQFQDRISQRIAHVIKDLEELHDRLTGRFGAVREMDPASPALFFASIMHGERAVSGIDGPESAGGTVELF